MARSGLRSTRSSIPSSARSWKALPDPPERVRRTIRSASSRRRARGARHQLPLSKLLPRRGARRRERAARPRAARLEPLGPVPDRRACCIGARDVPRRRAAARSSAAWSRSGRRRCPSSSTLFARVGQVVGVPENARRLLEPGEAIIVFPEGARGISKPFSQRYQLTEFGLGFMRLALETEHAHRARRGHRRRGAVRRLRRTSSRWRARWACRRFPLIPQLLFPAGRCRCPTKYRHPLRRADVLRGRSRRRRRVDRGEGRLVRRSDRSLIASA